jgi:titin
VTSTGLVTSYVVSNGIAADSIYQFKVQASNILGRGDPSLPSDPIRAASRPDAPSQPQKVSSTTSEISLNWNAPIYNGGNAVHDYLVYISVGTNDNYSELEYTGSADDFESTATLLDRGQLYWFKVTAWNVIGESEYSLENSILAATVPLAPDRPTIAVQTSNTITIAWLEPDNGGSNIDDYQVMMCVGQSDTC